MAKGKHTGMQSPGVATGDFVPIPVTKFREAYATFFQGVTGELPPEPDFPSEILDAASGKPQPFPDTPLNRAWHAAGKLFDADADRVSFYARINSVMPIAEDRKYAKYFDREEGSMHVALLSAVASVPFSMKTTRKALRAALDTEFRRRLAATTDPSSDLDDDQQTRQ